MLEGWVYLVTCVENKKVYVGQTWRKELRFEEHLIGLGSSELFQDVIRYGKTAFTFKVLKADIDSQDELDYWEKKWILTLSANDSKQGYNKSVGGEHFWSAEELLLKRVKAAITLIDRWPHNLTQYLYPGPTGLHTHYYSIGDNRKTYAEIKDKIARKEYKTISVLQGVLKTLLQWLPLNAGHYLWGEEVKRNSEFLDAYDETTLQAEQIRRDRMTKAYSISEKQKKQDLNSRIVVIPPKRA